MKTLELHILQSFPVTCLNRDDVGAPKSALFGGVQRARVSSQCWKRAIRDEVKSKHENKNEAFFKGVRGHFQFAALTEELRALGHSEPEGTAEKLFGYLANGKCKYKQGEKTDVATYYSPQQIKELAVAVVSGDLVVKANGKNEVSVSGKKLAQIISEVNDASDISIFGRMVANDHTLQIEGAGLFSHALSTHKVSNEVDFFSAIDETKPDYIENEGAGHIGSLEFNSACYYRYIALNLDLLRDEKHLAHFSDDELKSVVDAFIRASILAVPNARKNSMMGFNPPEYILGTIREGQPVSLANAFEEPVKARGKGYVQESIAELEKKFQWMEKTYGFKPSVALKIPNVGLDDFCKGLVDHV